MRGLGSGENGEFTFLDIISVMGFLIAVQNNNLLTQEDKKELESELSSVLDEIHHHLQSQDTRIDRILELLEVKSDAVNQET